MDRTIIVPYRAEEKELSHTLYNAIQGLFLLHPPTEDLRKCVSEEMFIKPNQQAFFHIMHYLFRILDAQEFKKRFFWPITDKRSESNFRTSTVEYLKYINEKYQLNWTNIKSYLVVMPGGMKFISFLLDFINFIVQELIKQKEKQLNLDANSYRPQVSEANLWKMCAKNEVFKDMASEFVDTVENINKKFDDNSHKLMKQLEVLSQETGLSVEMLTDDKFLEDFDNSNHQLFEQHYIERTKKVIEMDGLIAELKEAMDKFYSKETGYKYDKQRICEQLRRIRDHFPIEQLEEESFGTKMTDDGVNINTLICTFNAINATMRNALKIDDQRPSVGEVVYSGLLNLKKDLQAKEARLDDFQKMLTISIKKYKSKRPHTPEHPNIHDTIKRTLESNLLMKLVSTPSIKLVAPEGGGIPRLALVDSKTGNTNDTTSNNFLAPSCSTSRTNRHHSLVNQSNLNTTVNRSKIIDPMELLRLTSKKDPSKYKTTTPQLNLSNLGTKWKQRQCLFNDEETPSAPGHRSLEDQSNLNTTVNRSKIIDPMELLRLASMNDSPKQETTTQRQSLFNDVEAPSESAHMANVANTPKTHFKPMNISKTSPLSLTKTGSPTILHQSPFTPFNSNDRTRIARSQYQLDTSGFGTSGNSTGSTYVKKLAAVKKVQDASLNFANLSTSPSGRLEPLVTAEDMNIPKLKLNDISLIEHNLSLNNSMFFEKPKVLVNSPIANTITNDENNPNTNNIQNFNESENKKPEPDEEALFNISDSILKDVTL
ncbi:hypothetical protein FF38_06126 [Lucilia cuprina]|uniref:HAUS augmin-like complex subunit 6 N-terminal domain-containing protein n=1 Tax=Lucilia cuprina TaxID=7375 RepID=A0A0L0C6T6_LUCCU|nr:hypothetical protein FF38_06126 [Lucilia cuprina]